ncbi:hypothetical protein [Thalassotalea sp. PS06]|uniref:hypothetical protein n=1 Tax=Thalassotalea sp. PS06 TaxID=2594005 RepID=UPI0011640695|nr:hypothetical protein [Thalassotalea sp. PS06]QDP02178.1 hypothetical protein FNC98_13005 [Thalassotalea sp. PS06]
MKYGLALTLLTLVLSSTANAEISYSKFTDKGKFGPYARLLTSFDQVKVVKTTSGNEVKCRVDVAQGDTFLQGTERSVAVSELNKNPLRACLTRVEAKRLSYRSEYWAN